MKEVIVYQIDSFTKEKFKGNPAGVVLNAEHMTSEEMQLIARELNNSETAFVFRPETQEKNFDYHVRYFTPTTEVPSCGHATIAALYARAQRINWIPVLLKSIPKSEYCPFILRRRITIISSL